MGAVLKEQDDTEGELKEIAESLGLDGLDANGLDEVDRQLYLWERSLADWTSLNADHHTAIATVERREQGLEAAAGRVELSQATLIVVEDEWKAWLKERDLSDTFLPETMVEFRGQVESSLLQLGQVGNMRHRVAAIEEDIRQYTSLVEPLAAKYAALPDSKETTNVAAKADSLIARQSAAHDKMNLRKRAEEEARQAEEVYKRHAGRLKKAQADLAELR